MTILMQDFFSPEWAAVDGQYVTTQFGATITFQSKNATYIDLHFEKDYPKLQLIWRRDDQTQWQNLTTQRKIVRLPLTNQDLHQYTLMVQTFDRDHFDFWHNPVTLTAIETDGSLLPVHSTKMPITFVGDSITVGESIRLDGHHPELAYPFLVAQALGRPLVNISYGGTGLTPFAPYQVPAPIEALWQVAYEVERPRVRTDMVIVNYGTNDANYGATEQNFSFGLRMYLLELVKRFHEAKIIILVPFNGCFKNIFEQEMKRFSNITLISTADWQISPNQVHPNEDEHRRAATFILEELKGLK